MAYRKIEDGKLTAIANAIRSKLASTAAMTPDQMPALIETIGIGLVPDYWKSYLATKAAEINTALSAAGENKSAFLWYTDAHWMENFRQSPMLLKYLSKYTDMEKTFFGGDVACEASGEIDALTAWQALVRDIPNHHSVIGNHDNQVTDFTTAEERAEFFLQFNRTGDMVFGTDAANGKMYYYIDNHIEQTRYICLSTGRMWTTSDEIPWCIDALSSTPKGWHIVIIGHLWLNSDYSDDGVTLNPTPPDYAQSYLELFDAYNCRQAGTTGSGSAPYDFANAGGKVEFVIGGHVHRDYDFATAKGIPIILTECDAQYERDPESVATQGTTTENCVYAIVADYNAKAVQVINVGRGSTRTLAIPDVVTYTNVLPLSVGFDGAVLNANTTPGYAENSRYSSGSNAFSALSGTYATGMIPCANTATIRMRNISTEQANNYDAVYIFDKNDTNGDGHWYNTRYTFTQMLGNSEFKTVVDENGTIIEFTLPGWQVNQTHIAICSQYIGSDSIITVDEEIG